MTLVDIVKQGDGSRLLKKSLFS